MQRLHRYPWLATLSLVGLVATSVSAQEKASNHAELIVQDASGSAELAVHTTTSGRSQCLGLQDCGSAERREFSKYRAALQRCPRSPELARATLLVRASLLEADTPDVRVLLQTPEKQRAVPSSSDSKFEALKPSSPPAHWLLWLPDTSQKKRVPELLNHERKTQDTRPKTSQASAGLAAMRACVAQVVARVTESLTTVVGSRVPKRIEGELSPPLLLPSAIELDAVSQVGELVTIHTHADYRQGQQLRVQARAEGGTPLSVTASTSMGQTRIYVDPGAAETLPSAIRVRTNLPALPEFTIPVLVRRRGVTWIDLEQQVRELATGRDRLSVR